jgi:hypothetical protein
MITKAFDEIDAADVETLIRNQVRESRAIDYKEALPGNANDDKKEFLRDVISFANTSGGDLLFGIREARDGAGKPTGVPDPAAPVGLQAVSNIDQEIRRLDDIITNGVAPRITGVRIKALTFAAGSVLVARIPRSWAGPHMVTFQTRSPFTARRSASRVDMDVTDLRAAFLAHATVGEWIETFRRERLQTIVSGATGIAAIDAPLLIVHLVPIAAIDPANAADLTLARKETTELQPIGVSSWDYRYNADGFMTFRNEAEGGLRSYTQVFRSGVIEAVGEAWAEPQFKSLRIAAVESEVFRVILRSMNVQRRLGVEPPTSVLVTLTNIEGYRFRTEDPFISDFGNRPIDRAPLLLPEILLTDLPSDSDAVATLIRPAFDALWQAAGFARSFDYAENGEWKPDRRRR